MRRALLTFLMSLVWLIASPSLQLPNSGWVEVGAPNAAAAQLPKEPKTVDELQHTDKKKPVAKKRVGSSGVVISNQPGFHPMQSIVTQAPVPIVTGTEPGPHRLPQYPHVPAVRAFGAETSQDRVARCMHQGALGGLSAAEQGTYIHTCAF